jgi:hypothetical protein
MHKGNLQKYDTAIWIDLFPSAEGEKFLRHITMPVLEDSKRTFVCFQTAVKVVIICIFYWYKINIFYKTIFLEATGEVFFHYYLYHNMRNTDMYQRL